MIDSTTMDLVEFGGMSMAGEQNARVTRALVGGISVGGTVQTIPANSQIAFQETIAINQTNHEIDIAVTLANVQAMALEANQDCSVKTNSTGSPQETISLKANTPLIWVLGDLAAAKFFAGDITKFYVTTGGVATIFKFLAFMDQTP